MHQASLVALIEDTEDTDCKSSSAGSQMRVIDKQVGPTLATCSFSGANRTPFVFLFTGLVLSHSKREYCDGDKATQESARCTGLVLSHSNESQGVVVRLTPSPESKF